MKVILKGEVDNLGLAGDVVDVADGYARNYLLPRGMAIIATQGGMKEAEALTRSRKASEAKTLDSAKAAKDALEGRTLRIAARVDDRGSLYGSVGAVDVARVLKERGHDIPRKRIDLKGTIKVIGTYEIPVQVHPQVIATVTLEVVDEEGKVTVNEGGAIVNEDDVPPPPLTTEASELDELAQEALEAAEAYEAQLAEEEGDEAGEEADTSEDAEAGATPEAEADTPETAADTGSDAATDREHDEEDATSAS